MKRLIPLFALLGLLLALPASAATRYVTDEFKVTLRTGAGTGHRILRMLPSGTAVEILGSDRDSGYSEVRTADGTVGFILTRQLMNEPSARTQLATRDARIRELEAAPGELRTKLTAIEREYQALQSAHEELGTIKRDMEQELQSIRLTAANALRTAEERNELRTRVVALTRELEELKQQNRDLTNDSHQRWFLIGAGVIVGGIALGLILPHLRFQRRRSSWGSL